MPGNKKDLLLRGDRAEQALANIKIKKGQQQLLSKVPEIQNQIKFIDDELKEIRLASTDRLDQLNNLPRRQKLIKDRAVLSNQLKSINQNLVGSSRVKRNIFKRSDYNVNESLKRLTNTMADAGIDSKTIKKLEDSVINMRLGIDNLSGVLMQGGKLTDDQFKTFGSEIGGYINL